MTQTMEMLAFDDDGEPICKPIPRKDQSVSLVFKGFDMLEINKVLLSFSKAGIRTSEHFLLPNGSHEYRIKV